MNNYLLIENADSCWCLVRFDGDKKSLFRSTTQVGKRYSQKEFYPAFMPNNASADYLDGHDNYDKTASYKSITFRRVWKKR